MFNPSRRLILMSIFCGLIFVGAMVQLFLLRFEAGNVYPVYSSLRSDPLGTQALYESLRRLSADSVQRNFRSLHQLKMAPRSTLVIIGIKAQGFSWGWGGAQYEKLLENLADSGGRLVLTFTPDRPSRVSMDNGDEEQDGTPEKTDTQKPEAAEGKAESRTQEDKAGTEDHGLWDAAFTPLGFRFHTPPGEHWDDHADRFYGAADILPSTIPWRAPQAFRLRDNSWETLYTWQGEPVVVQRPWGKGTVVMVADSYLLSNEALRNHRVTGLLTWLVKPGNRIVFDESLKGLIEQPGIAGLARQYRLHGVFAALLAVVGLFVWRQSAIFIAPVQTTEEADLAQPSAGRDTRQGLVHLVRQHIAVQSLLTVCYQAWKGQAARRVSAERISEVEALVAAAAADPHKDKQVKTYIEICELLKQGKRS